MLDIFFGFPQFAPGEVSRRFSGRFFSLSLHCFSCRGSCPGSKRTRGNRLAKVERRPRRYRVELSLMGPWEILQTAEMVNTLYHMRL